MPMINKIRQPLIVVAICCAPIAAQAQLATDQLATDTTYFQQVDLRLRESGELLEESAKYRTAGTLTLIGVTALGMVIVATSDSDDGRQSGYWTAGLGFAVGFSLDLHSNFLQRNAARRMRRW